MDSTCTVEDLKRMTGDFCDERDWAQFHNSKDMAIGIATEAGELLELFRFKTNDESDEMSRASRRTDVCEELADTLYFVLRFAQINGIDLSEALKDKLAKNALKYPVDRVRGCNKKYDEY